MTDAAVQIEITRMQLVASLSTVADSLRQAATMAEQFSNVLRYPSIPQTTNASNNQNTVAPTNKKSEGKRKADSMDVDGDGAADKKVKRTRKPKDPNAPKRPASSYLLFQNDIRKQLKEQHPELSRAELQTLIANQWSTMPYSEKLIYNNAQADAKQKYDAEKAAYEASHNPNAVPAGPTVSVSLPAPPSTVLKVNMKKPVKAAKAAPAAIVPTAAKPRPQPSKHAEPLDSSDAGAGSGTGEAGSGSDSTSSESSEEEEVKPQPVPKKSRQSFVPPAPPAPVPAPKAKGKKAVKE